MSNRQTQPGIGENTFSGLCKILHQVNYCDKNIQSYLVWSGILLGDGRYFVQNDVIHLTLDQVEGMVFFIGQLVGMVACYEGMVAWCEHNCNHDPVHCPQSHCKCVLVES